MDINKRLEMSYYKPIATLHEKHKVWLVQNSKDNHIYVKKNLDIYNIDVYQQLIKHPIKGIPCIYCMAEEGNTLTIIEEFIAGKTLDELLVQKYSFSVEEIQNIVLQLCVILASLHECEPSIIHRDIKPSNIIMREDKQIVLLDLNAAKQFSTDKSEDTTLLGTKGYAAPEQYGFGVSNPQTDIYALGMLMNTLLYGVFNATTFSNSLLTPLIIKCTQLNPQDRYKNVDEIKYQLENLNSRSDTLFSNPDFSTNKDSKTLSNNTIVKQNPSEKNWLAYLPPGFRHLNLLKMSVATIIYGFTLWVCLTLEEENSTPVSLLVDRIMCTILFLGAYFIIGNYRNIQNAFPLCKSKNLFLHILGVILFSFLYVVGVFIIMVILSSFFR